MPEHLLIPEGYVRFEGIYQEGNLYGSMFSNSSNWTRIHRATCGLTRNHPNLVFCRRITKTEKGNILN